MTPFGEKIRELRRQRYGYINAKGGEITMDVAEPVGVLISGNAVAPAYEIVDQSAFSYSGEQARGYTNAFPALTSDRSDVALIFSAAAAAAQRLVVEARPLQHVLIGEPVANQRLAKLHAEQIRQLHFLGRQMLRGQPRPQTKIRELRDQNLAVARKLD